MMDEAKVPDRKETLTNYRIKGDIKMRRNSFMLLPLVVMLAFVAAISIGCATTSGDGKASATTASTSGGKLPVTTSSEDARKEYLQGRDLAERLLIQDSVQH